MDIGGNGLDNEENFNPFLPSSEEPGALGGFDNTQSPKKKKKKRKSKSAGRVSGAMPTGLDCEDHGGGGKSQTVVGLVVVAGVMVRFIVEE
jgi:hypothetical protein